MAVEDLVDPLTGVLWEQTKIGKEEFPLVARVHRCMLIL